MVPGRSTISTRLTALFAPIQASDRPVSPKLARKKQSRDREKKEKTTTHAGRGGSADDGDDVRRIPSAALAS